MHRHTHIWHCEVGEVRKSSEPAPAMPSSSSPCLSRLHHHPEAHACHLNWTVARKAGSEDQSEGSLTDLGLRKVDSGGDVVRPSSAARRTETCSEDKLGCCWYWGRVHEDNTPAAVDVIRLIRSLLCLPSALFLIIPLFSSLQVYYFSTSYARRRSEAQTFLVYLLYTLLNTNLIPVNIM